MPTLLRITLVLLTSGVLFAGIALLALAEVVGTPDGTRLALGSLAVCALALPPMLAGVFASYWSRDARARRRLRIALVVLLAVQAVGAAGLIVLTVTRSSLVVASVVLVLIAVALDPAVIAIGRAARRIELRSEAPTHDDAGFRERVRAGWRRGGIGAAIGLAAGILLCVLLLLPLPGRGDAASALLFLPAGAGLGASLGMLTVVLGLARRVRDLLGGDVSSARRIGRAVLGKPEALSDDERARAAHYASVAPAWLRLQTTQTAVNSLAVMAVMVGSLVGISRDGAPGIGWFVGGVLVVLVGSTVAMLVTRRRQLRRVRSYSADHPVAA